MQTADYIIDNTDNLLKTFPGVGTLHAYIVVDCDEFHVADGKILKYIKTIKTKNDALLNIKHDHHLVRYHCKRILES